MTPALFDLPLRLGDAAALATILLDQSAATERKPLTDEFRARAASRAAAHRFEAMIPCCASLERDPVHASALFICVDGADSQPLLLRVAPASTPSSGLFPKAILIGRTFAGDREVVLNAVPFPPDDAERILIFSGQVNKACQPAPIGSRPVILVTADDPAAAFPLAFEGLRRLRRSSGRQPAAFGIAEGQDAAAFYFATVWSAIRSGWRDGYTLHSASAVPPMPGVRQRPFEAALLITRKIHISADMSRAEIPELFQPGRDD